MQRTTLTQTFCALVWTRWHWRAVLPYAKWTQSFCAIFYLLHWYWQCKTLICITIAPKINLISFSICLIFFCLLSFHIYCQMMSLYIDYSEFNRRLFCELSFSSGLVLIVFFCVVLSLKQTKREKNAALQNILKTLSRKSMMQSCSFLCERLSLTLSVSYLRRCILSTLWQFPIFLSLLTFLLLLLLLLDLFVLLVFWCTIANRYGCNCLFSALKPISSVLGVSVHNQNRPTCKRCCEHMDLFRSRSLCQGHTRGKGDFVHKIPSNE